MPRLAEFENLVVMRTVSKIGMAGLRLGYVAGRPEWIDAFNKTRSPFNINVLTEAVAIKLLREQEGARRAGRQGAGGARAPAAASCERLPGLHRVSVGGELLAGARARCGRAPARACSSA